MNAKIGLEWVAAVVPLYLVILVCLVILSDKLVAVEAIDYRQNVAPLMEKYCVDCDIEGMRCPTGWVFQPKNSATATVDWTIFN